MPEETREAIDTDNWLHTGDLAVMDENGYCKITGRIKNMIIRGGENIYPREIEEFLYTHPKVSDVQVFGVPSRKYGEQVMAYLKLKHGETAADEEIRAFCKERIALQDPELRQVRRRVPDDRQRQDPEVQAARAGDPETGTRGCGGGNRLTAGVIVLIRGMAPVFDRPPCRVFPTLHRRRE